MNVITTYPSNIKVWVNGVFDILHVGHVQFLEFAKYKAGGNYLTVGIDSDERVKLLKGESRPYNNQHDRMMILKAIKYIDDVVIFNSDEELCNFIKESNIVVMVDEYKNKKIVGKEYIKNLVFFPRILQYSSTNYINALTKKPLDRNPEAAKE